MNPIETLGLALGAGFSSGLNLYATVATLGLLQRFGVLRLPPGLQALAHPWVLGIAIALYLLEFLADKIPYFDTVWDAVHTFIRPPAAAILAYAAASGAAPERRWSAALIAGGVALTSHGTKASARAAVNASPEPFSNWALSFGEDVLAVWLTWMATVHPFAATIIVAALVALSAFLLYHLSVLRSAPFSASSQRNCAPLGKAVISNTRQANPKTSCTKTARSAASAPSGLRREKRPASTALPAVAAR